MLDITSLTSNISKYHTRIMKIDRNEKIEKEMCFPELRASLADRQKMALLNSTEKIRTRFTVIYLTS